MARIRTIKPEFFTSEDIVGRTPLARLLYIAVWCEADKEGRLVWKPMTFKLRYFPGDNCDIHAMCKEIVDAGLVKLYGDGFAVVPQFSRHQHVNPRESVSVLPTPPDYVLDAPKKITADVREEVMERDGNKCVRCNSTDNLTLDHILPQSLQGTHSAENLRVMCRCCHSGRPVSGKGLVDDLALDGLSLEILRKRFGIDASARVSTRANPDRHPQVGREGKGKEGDRRVASFETFYSAYPRKEARKDAESAFAKLNPDDALLARMVAVIDVKRASVDWTKDGGKFIPLPATWIRAERWNDEGTGAALPGDRIGSFI